MSMLEWAKNEVELALERERGVDNGDGLYEYAFAAHMSALKAYETLLGDEHTGLSMSLTKQILNRLIERKPLTPIENTDDVWKPSLFPSERCKTYQCKRMSSLFKDVYPDGSVKYIDINRVSCRYYPQDVTFSYSNGLVTKIIDEMYPIIFPYVGGKYLVSVEEFLSNSSNGDFDTMHIIDVILPNGEVKKIDRYFTQDVDGDDNGWREITRTEYETMKTGDNEV